MKKLLLLTILLLAGCQQTYKNTVKYEPFDYQKLGALDLTGLTVSQMSLEEKIYQSLILGFDGTAMTPELNDRLQKKLGGVILFSRNIESVTQTQGLNHSIAGAQTEIPPFIGVDQEGGRVNRLPRELGNTADAYTLAQSGSEAVHSAGKWNGQMLKLLGFNLDFSTVLDIWTNPANTVIGNRSFGTTAEAVTKNASAFNKGLHSEGIVTVGKHFPGHGDTFLDSHLALPVSEADMNRLKKVELVPFNNLQDEIDMMMVSHIVVSKLDALPSSLSAVVTKDVLQKELGFDGVVITDDLAMGAIADRYTKGEAAAMAIQAGNTMVLIGSDVGDVDVLVQTIADKVRNGEISETVIDENVQKILRLKTKYDIL
ncbi:glycoside hydrolase family 3 N-terminal domain-containing protein [Macrococcus brunensis]|uniref:glycoside hydrolase family 3 N-terminal domain-containing protein n=1 Tax=Macrococcus brunensis TaxID=198483 RepID=UPI001EF113D8|nr:glycoside hydrolase family 3 N-terminal domain-containing protein [Macrococcus brunensis]ULG73536.1 beta-N-acetylhexosaminidase [Macrococcus brunensis]